MKKILILGLVLSLFSCSKNENKDSQLETKNKIFQMLISNGIKKENILFVEHNVDEEKFVKFSSFEEFEKFISERNKKNKVQNFPLSEFQISSYEFDNEFVGEKRGEQNTFHIQREMRGWKDFHVTGTYYLETMSSLSGWSVTSYITGLTFGITYEHKYSKMYFEGIDNLKVEGGGILNYNVFYENIGTIFTDDISFLANVKEPYKEFELYKSF